MTTLKDAGAGVALRPRSDPGTPAAISAAPHRPHRLTVDDVMSRDVVTVPPTATFHDMAGLMTERGVSALPVVDPCGELLGIVSEADMLHKQTTSRPWRLWFPERRGAVELQGRDHAVDAASVMTTPVVSVRSGAAVAVAIRLLHRHHIKRLVVLGPDHRMVGIVSRHDLLAGFNRSDEEIHTDIVDGVIPRWLLVDPSAVDVEVRGGVVRLSGTVERRSDAEVLPHLVRGLDGVVDVESALDHRFDDRHTAPSGEQRVR